MRTPHQAEGRVDGELYLFHGRDLSVELSTYVLPLRVGGWYSWYPEQWHAASRMQHCTR